MVLSTSQHCCRVKCIYSFWKLIKGMMSSFAHVNILKCMPLQFYWVHLLGSNIWWAMRPLFLFNMKRCTHAITIHGHMEKELENMYCELIAPSALKRLSRILLRPRTFYILWEASYMNLNNVRGEVKGRVNISLTHTYHTYMSLCIFVC